MAESFTLDTSGHVVIDGVRVGWEAGTAPFHIDPFAQGYIEAVLREAGRLPEPGWQPQPRGLPRAFSDLAPATLARILKDCEAYQETHADLLGTAKHPDPRRPGRLFWIARQNGASSSFPPLTLHLGDDGLIYFGEV